MLSGAGAAEGEAQGHDVVEHGATTLHTGRIGPVDHDLRVHVAVAGMPDDADDRVLSRRYRDDAVEKLGEAGHGHGDVVDDDRPRARGEGLGGELLDRRMRQAAGGQELLRLDGVGRHVHLGRSGPPAHIGQRVQIVRRPGSGVGGGQEQRRRRGRQAHGPEILDRPQVHAVEQLEHARSRPGLGDRGDGGAGLGHRIEDGREGERRVGHGSQREGDLGDDAERPLGSDEQPSEVEAGHPFPRTTSTSDNLAAGENNLEAEDVLTRHAILHAAHAAGVGGHIAADGGLLPRARGRVGTAVRARPPRGRCRR